MSVRADDLGARLVSGEAIDDKKEKINEKIEAEEIKITHNAHTKLEDNGAHSREGIISKLRLIMSKGVIFGTIEFIAR